MDFDSSFSLEQMMRDAQTQMNKTKERLDSIDNTATKQLVGHSRAGLVGAVLVSLLLAAALPFAYCRYGHYMPEIYEELPVRLFLKIMLGAALALVVFVAIGNLVELRYYGAILRARRRLSQLGGRVAKGQKSLSRKMEGFLERRGARWELPLKPGDSIDREAGRISARLAGMEALGGGFLAKLKTVLYYAVCIVWAVLGPYVVLTVFYVLTGRASGESSGSSNSFESLGRIFSPETMNILIIVLLAVGSCIAEVLIAAVVWFMTDKRVGNVTLLGLLPGLVVWLPVLIAEVLVLLLADFAAAVVLAFV